MKKCKPYTQEIFKSAFQVSDSLTTWRPALYHIFQLVILYTVKVIPAADSNLGIHRLPRNWEKLFLFLLMCDVRNYEDFATSGFSCFVYKPLLDYVAADQTDLGLICCFCRKDRRTAVGQFLLNWVIFRPCVPSFRLCDSTLFRVFIRLVT